ncbi:class I SAM-dependent methyltransferase [Patescibacteria group bacterium]|nr:class I SAM-dependent methyltransferase [Patescibacteria group bacterium]
MKLSLYYESDYYVHQNGRELEQMYETRLGYLRKALEEYRFTVVLDAACGDGRLSRLVKRTWNVPVYGVDISGKGVRIAKTFGIKAKVGDLSERIPFRSRSFDLVLSSETIEHLVNPDTFLKEVRRTLRPGGLLVLTSPNLASWLNRILFLFGVYPLVLEASTEKRVGLRGLSKFMSGEKLVGHIHVFSYYALADFLHHHGFRIEKVVGMPIAFESPRSKLLTALYSLVDRVFTGIIPLSSNYVVVAGKRDSDEEGSL